MQPDRPDTLLSEQDQTRLLPVANDLERLSASTGHEFLQTFVNILQEVLQVEMIAISQLHVTDIERIQVKAGWLDGESLINFEYEACSTPCIEAIKTAKMVLLHRGIQQAYPDDLMLQEKGLESFLAYPVLNQHSEVIGLVQLGWKHETSLEEVDQIIETISDFSDRIGNELENLRALRILKALARGPESPSQGVFHLITQQIQLLLGVRAVFVAECSEQDPAFFNILAYCEDGKWLDDKVGALMSYEGKPCEVLKDQPTRRIQSGLPELFADDPRYGEGGFDAYLGIRVENADKEMIGHIVAFNGEPITTHQLETELLSVLRDRLGFELMRHRALR
ncbi:GAF domain-containing protein [Phaeobacter sp.]|uniref:GAF domain-containing protein n=1 Tax=Phaeobacter sp. TaxID=1902409 RepID=UPI0025FB956E|nr:GAF domain-containing protein [Phaeobacter sp.]